jgi:hypothetical protein
VQVHFREAGRSPKNFWYGICCNPRRRIDPGITGGIMLRRTLATVGLVMAAVAVLLSGGPSFAQEKTPLEKITFATDWKAQAEHGGFYHALAATRSSFWRPAPSIWRWGPTASTR